MPVEQDPALAQEGVTDDATITTADLPAGEDAAESSEESGEGAGSGTDTPHDDKDKAEEFEIVVAGEESPSSKESAAPAWVKDLRKEHRELKARNAELERTLQAHTSPAVADPGPKPTLESCDFDSGVFETKLESWHEARRKKEGADAQASQAADASRRAWQSRLDAYAAQKGELLKQIPSFTEAETIVQGMLDVTQQGVIIHGAENAALVIAALGQNPKLAQDLANTKDPIAFAFKVAKLEGRLTTKKKSQAPPPEKPVRGTGPSSGSVDSTLERLRSDAAKTGDFSKVIEYNRQKKRK